MLRFPTSILMILLLASAGAGAETLLVDGRGSGDFSRIQDAINASEAGWKIIVMNGTYRESLVVDRSVTLRGDGKPVVSGSGSLDPLITINASGVVLDGFVLVAGAVGSSLAAVACDSAAVLSLSDGSRIVNNTISGSPGHGIFLLNSTGHLVADNQIHDNLLAGIRLYRVSDSQIKTSEVCRNAYGIFIDSSQENWASTNEIWGNRGDGITIEDSIGNEFTSNSIHNNTGDGLRISESKNNIIVSNRIADSENSGIDIYRSHSIMIASNTIDRSAEMGINVDSSDNNVVVQNTLRENDLNGIAIHGSQSNTVSKNSIKNNRESGVSLRHESQHNLIMKNDISGNKRYGLVIDESSLNFVQDNRIRNNGDGIIIRYARENFLVDNGIEDNIFGISLEFVDNAVVSKNNIINSTRDGIRLLHAGNCKITGNDIQSSLADGVHLLKSSGTVVSDNVIEDSGEYGVQVLDHSDQNLFMLNLIRDSSLGGVYIFDGEFNLVTSNALIDNGKFNGRDNRGNRWSSNYYSDYEGVPLPGHTAVGADPYPIYGSRGAVTFDLKPFLTYHYWGM
ncbi:MAG: right-handed parallel beta-helix repeat-containing protein [Methanothrix sp.]